MEERGQGGGREGAGRGQGNEQPVKATVLSVWKALVGLMRPITIGFHILTEILNTSHPRHLRF